MTRFLTLILTLLFFRSAAQPTEHLETILLNCLTDSYEAVGVDVLGQLERFESHLIENGSLDSANGQAYYDFFKKVEQLNDIPASGDLEEFEGLYKLHPNQYYAKDCLEELSQLDSNAITASKYYALVLAMQSLSTEEELTPSLVAAEITSVLKPADFEQPFYRSLALLALAYTAEKERGILHKRPVKPWVEDKTYARLHLQLTEEDEILLDQKAVETQEFRIRLRDFILTHESKHILFLQLDPGTSYAFYRSVQETIGSIYAEIREQEAQSRYGVPFDLLEEKEKQAIISTYPLHLEESL